MGLRSLLGVLGVALRPRRLEFEGWLEAPARSRGAPFVTLSLKKYDIPWLPYIWKSLAVNSRCLLV